MQIRIQARKIQCIRSIYDPEIKRSRQKVVASFASWCRSLSDAPAAAIAALDEPEQAQLGKHGSMSAPRTRRDGLQEVHGALG